MSAALHPLRLTHSPDHPSSALQLTYSPILRAHDAGVLMTGSMPSLPLLNLTSSLVIPPHTRHHHWDLCPAECLRRHLPKPAAINGTKGHTNTTWAAGGDKGAVLLYTRLHMHQIGTGGEIRVRV